MGKVAMSILIVVGVAAVAIAWLFLIEIVIYMGVFLNIWIQGQK